MRISVIVPVYNEEETVAQIIEALSQVPYDLEVIVVDDGSTDRSWKILQELRQKEPFNAYHYIQHSYNQGKGACLQTGFGLITGDLVVVQDADMEYNPQNLSELVRIWEEAGNPEVAVYGVRDLSGQKFFTRWGNRLMTKLTNILYGCDIHDLHTCYKVIPVKLARTLQMKSRRFSIDPEITAHIILAGYKILETPISYIPREAKKLSPWKDGWPALAVLLRYRFSKRYQVATSLPIVEEF
jgi:dolichol-phosphate mannosyltransferase